MSVAPVTKSGLLTLLGCGASSCKADDDSMATHDASKNMTTDLAELFTMLPYVATSEGFEALSHGDSMFQN